MDLHGIDAWFLPEDYATWFGTKTWRALPEKKPRALEAPSRPVALPAQAARDRHVRWLQGLCR
jgi:hypothetical protein